MSRFSFTTGAVTAQPGASVPISPIQIPAVGYLSHIDLEVTVTTSGATSATTVLADGPFSIIQSLEFRTAAGNDIIVPLTGYQMYLANKYGAQFCPAPYSDAKLDPTYANTSGASAGAHFFLPIPLSIDAGTGYGAIPALASNRSYQAVITLAPLSSVYGTAVPTNATVTINAVAYYWSEPPANTATNVPQATAPSGIGSVSQWQIEQPAVTPGDKLIKSNNVGNVIRTLIFTLRTAAGARTDTDFPAVSELYLDNEPMFYFGKTEWKSLMGKWFGLTNTTLDAAGGLDTGVFVIPFYALTGSLAGDVSNSRSQLLPTVDASQLQIRGTSFGANSSTLEIVTNSVIPRDAATLYAR